jgi:hypothetical protein
MRKRRMILGLVMLMLGVLTFLPCVSVMDAIPAAAVVHLTGSGACFGFGVAALCGLFRMRGE